MKIETQSAVARPVLAAPGLAFPPWVKVRASETPDGVDVEVTVVVHEGRLVARELIARWAEGGSPVTGEALRRIAVAGLIEHAARHLGRVEDHGDEGVEVASGYVDELELLRAKAAGPNGQTLQLVARLYRVALLTGRTPTKTLEEWFEMPRSSIARWIALARAAGHLDPAPAPGKAGG